MPEHRGSGLADCEPRIIVRLGQEFPSLFYQLIVVSKDHILLRAELPKKGTSGDTGRSRNVFDAGGFKALLCK